VDIDVQFVGGRGMDRHHAARLVLQQVLGARLLALRDERAVTYGFGAVYLPRLAGGLWAISGAVDAARAAEAAEAVIAILTAMRADPETYRGEFVLARQSVLEGLLVSTGSASATADRLADLARFDLPDNFYDRVARDVAKLTLRDFHSFVATELRAEHQVFGAFGNADAVAATLEAARRAAASREGAR
jgi:predicted Zn-dependent peptidase